MLKHLLVENFAIIDRIELDFYSGMTVLTGETGAGKSILIDAISLLLGDRANQDMIRTGKQSALVSGRFLIENYDLKSVIARMGIDLEKDEIEIYREITSLNKNTIKINGQIVTLQQLKEITQYLADIHSQFDTQRLINPQNYLDLLDGFKKDLIAGYQKNYLEALSSFKNNLREHEAILERKRKFEASKEIYEFQYQELGKLALEPDEIAKLQGEVNILKNYDKVYETLMEVNTQFDEFQVLDSLYNVMTAFDKLQRYSDEYQELFDKTANYYYELKEVARETGVLTENLNFDPDNLNRLQERLYELEKVREKYKKDIPELCQYRDDLKTLINESEDFDSVIKKSLQDLEMLFQKTLVEAKNLSQARKEIALRITKELETVFKDLSLANTRFEVRFSSPEPSGYLEASLFKDQGIDQIDFYLSTNLGEPLKPLSRTASGGEMSRIMLAFKTIFIRQQNLSTMIFDEIDTGISGKIAKQIAKKFKEISQSCQVLSITHIPQVVAAGNHHLLVEKKDFDKRTNAYAHYLDFAGRVTDIAMMISGDKISPSSIQSAKELLLDN